MAYFTKIPLEMAMYLPIFDLIGSGSNRKMFADIHTYSALICIESMEKNVSKQT